MKIVAVVRDLIFRSKIEEVAKQLGQPVTFCVPKELLRLAAANSPDLIIVDLEDQSGELLNTISTMARKDTKRFTVGYLSHVRTDLREAALKAGVDLALPRSVFVRELPHLLKGRNPVTSA